VADGKPRPAHYSYALSTSAAFGGANSAIIVGLDPNSTQLEAAPEEPVGILGACVLAAHGSEGFDEALRAAAPLWTEIASKETPVRFAARIPAETLAAPLRGVDARELDVVSRQLTLATLLALKNAGVRLRGPLRDRAGLYVGAYRLPWDSADAFWDSIRERGFSRASAPAFARMVMNAALGTTSRALSLRGPVSLVAGGPGSGLAALLLASEALAKRRDADVIAAAGAFDLGLGLLDEHAHRYPAQPTSNDPFPVYFPDDSDADERPVWAEGAASIVLSTARFARDGNHKPLAHLAGAAVAGPGRLAEAIRAALRKAGLDPSSIDAVYGSADGRRASGQREIDALREVFGPHFLTQIPLSNPAPVLGYAESLDLISFAAALEAIRTGRAHPLAHPSPAAHPGAPSPNAAPERRVRVALVITDDEASGSAAALITAPDYPSIESNSSSIQKNEPAVPNG
jgi:act minimal PKS chain-length factor (CLF/KS beta)